MTSPRRKATVTGGLWRTKALTTALLILFLFYSLLPIFYLVVSATKDNATLFSSFGLWFASSFHVFSNLHDVFTYDNGVYVNWLWNTAYYSISSALGAAFVSTIAGYAFAKFRFPGRTLWFAVILGSIMVPQTALVIPTYFLLSKVALIDTPLAVILPSLVSPFGVYLMRVYAEQSVPDDLLDAARVDGAGELRIFWSVAFRVLVPGFVTVLLLSFVATWNNYFLRPGVVERFGGRGRRSAQFVSASNNRSVGGCGAHHLRVPVPATLLAGGPDLRQPERLRA